VDLILSPGTAIPSPPVLPDSISDGFSNVVLTSQIMRFAFMGNFFGFPSLSLPAAYNENNLPLSVHLSGRNWEEHTVLRVANAIEQEIIRKKPQVHYSVL